MMINKGKNPLSHSSSSSSSSQQNSRSLASTSSLPSLIKNDGAKASHDNLEESNNYNNSNAIVCTEKEHMFDKVVTPSDVGKLNRLVIPKQHAEKYFPLDTSINKNGLLLNFADRDGKEWRFRYSYWNSSQSYVITKGWSRFVKDKKLDSGDVVSFYRTIGKDRLYIDWRRHFIQQTLLSNFPMPQYYQIHRSVPWSPSPPTLPPVVAAAPSRATVLPYSQLHLLNSVSCPYYRTNFRGGVGDSAYNSHGSNHVSCTNYSPAMWMQRGGDVVESTVLESVPVVHRKAAAAKQLRLFGVNMECPVEDECDVALSSTNTMQQFPTVETQPPQLSSPSSFSLQLSLHNAS